MTVAASETGVIKVLLVDPSLFTAPYDAALTDGLVAADVLPSWAVRPTRPGDRQEIPLRYVDAFFYRHVDKIRFLPPSLRAVAKGIAHIVGLTRVMGRVVSRRPDVVHFQWLVVPLLDLMAIKLIGLLRPVILTVHDTVPFNGEHLSVLQNFAFDVPLRACARVIVHTRAGKDRLLGRGLSDRQVVVIPHGPLSLPSMVSPRSSLPRSDTRLSFVMFGEIKHYKGVDILIEAVALLPPALREQARFIVAGRPMMDMAPLNKRITDLHLEGVIELRAHRLTEGEMVDLFVQTDCFLFPYRQIDASGVYFLTKSLGKWLIASRVGVFAEEVQEGRQGALIPPEDPQALAQAIGWAIMERPVPQSLPPGSAWSDIGRSTRALYQQVCGQHAPAALAQRAGS